MDQWKEENPDWERYYTPDNAPGEVGSGRINFVNLNLDGMTFSKSYRKCLVQLSEDLSMARRKRASAEQPIGVGLTTKQMKLKKPFSQEYLVDIEPLTDNQKRLLDSYKEGKHLVAYGCAGTGKTFITV